MLPLRKLHGRIHDAVEEAKHRRELNQLIEAGRRKTNNRSKDDAGEENYPVDFVVLWVDGNDPAWQADKNRYLPKDKQTGANNSAARFREWGIFQYWFRAVEKYAPWVRNVYVVTWGHFPSFLKADHPKLKLVRHDQFMPSEYLPTFSCFPTELNLWRIEGISEHIVYFNDDMFLTRPVEKSDFFCNGFPKYCGVAYPAFPRYKMTAWEHNLFNTAGIANDVLDLRTSVSRYPEKWFSEAYGDWGIKYNLQAYENERIMGMLFSHLGVPYRCSTMKAVWEKIPDRLDSTSRNRFRTMDDVFHQIFQIWEIYNGTFEPVSPGYYGIPCNVSLDNINEVVEWILGEDNRMVCVNDWEGITNEDFVHLKQMLQETFAKKYPEKSSFEK